MFVIYTEDSGKRGPVVVENLVRRLLLESFPGTQERNIEIRAVGGEPRRAMGAHRWKSRSDPLRRALVNDLATRFTVGDLVVFHYDGDEPWSGDSSCKHDAQVAELLGDVDNRMGREHPEGRFLRLVPFYSIESWLYLNRKVVQSLVDLGCAPRTALEWLDQNRDEAGGYDFVVKPKAECPLGDRCNQNLTEQWSARHAKTASPSWMAVVEAWCSSQFVREHFPL